ncbi:Uu.00g112600.m01.CDS01 [Anthostomella pinea]|uniref:Uu.00g112600.m01.CDS01 n=1 Tax=Anthostomella pinea TaxID=933095 RepID=A0AAI8VG04_9PEZI|nr:Uu.00g112600.m01.CDS01 [Anthostomella pinea]
MAENPARSFGERARYERRAELAKLTRDKKADLSLILGLSWRVKGRQVHIDYSGGLDTAKIRGKIASSVGKLNFSNALPSVPPPVPTEVRPEEGEKNEPQAQQDEEGKAQLPSLKDALVQAAPVDFQCGRGPCWRAEGGRETTEAYHARLDAETWRKQVDFAGILSQIDTTALAEHAHSLLENLRAADEGNPPGHKRPELALPQVSAPFFGDAHVFYVLQSWDDRKREFVKWVVKIPATGTPDTWDRLSAETLRTEGLLLRMLEEQTNIPAPRIIDADPSPHNTVHVPYLIMEFVQGRRLEDVWFGVGEAALDAEALKDRRLKILENVAMAMFELGRFESGEGGSPRFAPTGEFAGAGALQELDVQAVVERWFGTEDCERTPLHAAVGPWDEPRDAYTAMLDTYPPGTEAGEGVDRLLRLLIGLVREPGLKRRNGVKKPLVKTGRQERKKPFVLAHPDLSLRNIIMDADGDGTTIRAFLGWDGARVAPRSLGNEALPRWLVRDYNLFVWRWRASPDFWRVGGGHHVPPACNRAEDAPWVLRELRDAYVEVVGRLKSAGKGGGDDGGREGREEEPRDRDREGERVHVNVTRQSLLALSLDAAARDPRCRTAVLRRVLEKCSRSFGEFDFERLVGILGDGQPVDGYTMKCLRRGVRELVENGFVRGAVVC